MRTLPTTRCISEPGDWSTSTKKPAIEGTKGLTQILLEKVLSKRLLGSIGTRKLELPGSFLWIPFSNFLGSDVSYLCLLSWSDSDGRNFVTPSGVCRSFPNPILLLGLRLEMWIQISLGSSCIVPFFLRIQSVYLNPSNYFACLGHACLFFFLKLEITGPILKHSSGQCYVERGSYDHNCLPRGLINLFWGVLIP